MKNYKIISISDNHGLLDFKLPSGFCLTISGDITPTNVNHVVGQEYWLNNHFLPWCDKLIKDGIFEHICFIAGNHDRIFEKMIKDNKVDEFKKSLHKNIHYLFNSMVDLEGIKIYGTPFTTTFGNWYLMQSESVLDETFSNIPEGLDILLSHGPAYGWNDVILKGPYKSYERGDEHIGSKSLRKHILRTKPKNFCWGHIHENSHKPIIIPHLDEKLNKIGETIGNCVSILDDYYEIGYDPYEFTIIKE